ARLALLRARLPALGTRRPRIPPERPAAARRERRPPRRARRAAAGVRRRARRAPARRRGHRGAPLERASAARRVGGVGDGAARRVWLEKVPFVILAGASATVALTAQRSVGALQTLGEVTAAHRAGAAMLQVGFYLWRTLWPVRLLPLYEFPLDIGPLQRWALAGAGTVLALAAAAVVLRHRCPALGAALAAYLIALSPTLGLAQSGPQVAADRYTYPAL